MPELKYFLNTMNSQLPILSLENAPTSTWRIGDDIRITHGVYPAFPFPSEFHFRDFIMVYLKKGSVSGRCNGVNTYFTAPCMLIIQPTNVLEFCQSSHDADAIALSFSPMFTNRLNLLQRFQLTQLLCERPSLSLEPEMRNQLESYIEQVVELGRNPQNPFQDEALVHLTLSFFYGVGYYYYQTSQMTNRSQQIVADFNQLVEQYGVEEHYIDFYADKLHLSPKYLQRVIRDMTGRTAYEWVADVIIRRAKQLLAESNKTLQQIANELHFCDQSYFGVYFKRATGMTPKTYMRMQQRK